MESSQNPNPEDQPPQPVDPNAPLAGPSSSTTGPPTAPANIQAAAGSSTAQGQLGQLAASSAGPSQPRTRMLLACDRCRSRKSKCDRNLPSCTSCLQAGVPCMTAERDRFLSSDGRHVPRDYIENLERQVRELEHQYHEVLVRTSVNAPGNPFSGAPPAGVGVGVGIESAPGAFLVPQHHVPNDPGQQMQGVQEPQASIADPLSFENTLLQAIRLSGADPLRAEAPNLLFGPLSATVQGITALSILKGMDNSSLSTAVDNYFHFIHSHYPLLIREDIRNKFNIMIQDTYQSGMISPADEFVVYLVVVLGMTTSASFRSVPIYAQMLYYSALRIPNLFENLDSIAMTQALILIVIYSLYDPCAGSSWHLLDIVASKCLSMGLHLISSTLGNGIESTAKAWAFWTLYSLDRMSGASMGRPFTIANDDIVTVPVPGVLHPGQSDNTGYLSGPLITYYQLLYRSRRDPDVGFSHWKSQFEIWRDSTKSSVLQDIQISANPHSPEFIDSMNKYIDLVYYQGLLLIPQFNIEYPTITPEITDLYSSETMYHASKMVGLSFAVHRFPLAWTAGYKAFATGMSYLLALALKKDRSTVHLPEVYHVSTACINTIEGLSGRFDGLTPYARFLVRAVDMMLRLYNVEGRNSSIANDPYFLYTPYSDAVPRSPNSGVPRPPDVADLHVRRFRCLSRMYLAAMEDIRTKLFPGT
ncbi:hypothetical protein H072_6040 [Dactylellina haptotyla CBS 200.50]|uniref:Zn(2)-C6 fungal-type domain-containing protein n=1 Tax=Dactylellina haptotyla (strain CBS 200.50) TaxID=1284197 RepID=S8AB30_DACHA|nr:hypothetical protein H072_6040 [Dactylellina haptotyla CBS 200.50]